MSNKSSLTNTINLLQMLNDQWPKNFMLFAGSGSVLLVQVTTGKIIKSFAHILCDGGDPNIEERDDGPYMSQLSERTYDQ